MSEKKFTEDDITKGDKIKDLEEKIKEQIANTPILLYMKGTCDNPRCGFSDRAAKILNLCGVNFCVIDILSTENSEVRYILPKISSWPTFPQLFVNGELIGGHDIICDLFYKGELQGILKAANKKTEG